MNEEMDGKKPILQLEINFNNQCRKRDKKKWMEDRLHCTCTASVGIVL